MCAIHPHWTQPCVKPFFRLLIEGEKRQAKRRFGGTNMLGQFLYLFIRSNAHSTISLLPHDSFSRISHKMPLSSNEPLERSTNEHLATCPWLVIQHNLYQSVNWSLRDMAPTWNFPWFEFAGFSSLAGFSVELAVPPKSSTLSY